jgi:ACR3 family arsenite efflux pump ArsB
LPIFSTAGKIQELESKMNQANAQKPKWPIVLGVFLMLFGLATIKEGGAVLFFEGAARQAAGNYVPFVLWFNFFAGFAYIGTAIGILKRRSYARWLALGIAGTTLAVFVALAIYISLGGRYETRTLAAMVLRSLIWIGATGFLVRKHVAGALRPPPCQSADRPTS